MNRAVSGVPSLTFSGSISGTGTLPVELNSGFPQFQYSMIHDGTMAEISFAAESECQSKRKCPVAVLAEEQGTAIFRIERRCLNPGSESANSQIARRHRSACHRRGRTAD